MPSLTQKKPVPKFFFPTQTLNRGAHSSTAQFVLKQEEYVAVTDWMPRKTDHVGLFIAMTKQDRSSHSS